MNSSNFLGVTIGLLAIMTASLVMTTVNTTPQGNTSDPGQGIIVPNDTGRDIPVVVDHITRAQASLQNGDIEGANNHLELAKQSLQMWKVPPRP